MTTLLLEQLIQDSQQSNLNETITAYTPTEAAAYLNETQVIFIDVREKIELDTNGKIPGAIHIPLNELKGLVDPESPYYQEIFTPDKTYLFYCPRGNRSKVAIQQAREIGLNSVAHIEGGFNAWQAAGGAIQWPVSGRNGADQTALPESWQAGDKVVSPMLVEKLIQHFMNN